MRVIKRKKAIKGKKNGKDEGQKGRRTGRKRAIKGKERGLIVELLIFQALSGKPLVSQKPNS